MSYRVLFSRAHQEYVFWKQPLKILFETSHSNNSLLGSILIAATLLERCPTESFFQGLVINTFFLRCIPTNPLSNFVGQATNLLLRFFLKRRSWKSHPLIQRKCRKIAW
jgi:hypothetical protein